MSFDKKKYNAEYEKNNYCKKTVRLRDDLAQEIDKYCQYEFMSFNEFINIAARFYIDSIKGDK